jgi:2'-5' RNA ligase
MVGLRMFVAVVPPDDVVRRLDAGLAPYRAALLHSLDGVEPAPRWTTTEQWHVTLAFLPSVPAAVLPDLTRRLQRIAARREALDLSLAGGGAFPQRSRARVLWVGVDAAGLRELATAARAAATKAGTEVPGSARFRGHVTVARLTQPCDASGWVEQLRGYRGPSWNASSIHLIRSHLGEGPGRRSRYETVATFELSRGTGR